MTTAVAEHVEAIDQVLRSTNYGTQVKKLFRIFPTLLFYWQLIAVGKHGTSAVAEQLYCRQTLSPSAISPPTVLYTRVGDSRIL